MIPVNLCHIWVHWRCVVHDKVLYQSMVTLLYLVNDIAGVEAKEYVC